MRQKIAKKKLRPDSYFVNTVRKFHFCMGTKRFFYYLLLSSFVPFVPSFLFSDKWVGKIKSTSIWEAFWSCYYSPIESLMQTMAFMYVT